MSGEPVGQVAVELENAHLGDRLPREVSLGSYGFHQALRSECAWRVQRVAEEWQAVRFVRHLGLQLAGQVLSRPLTRIQYFST